MPRGGYQKPSNPAPVSGPGALSQRTDGGPGQPIRELPNADYGEAKTFREAQQNAPLASSGAPSPSGAAPGGQGGPQAIGFDADTMNPGEPVTAGADAGEGPGMEALGLTPERSADMEKLRAALPFLEWKANQPGSSWAARNLVRKIKASGGEGSG